MSDTAPENAAPAPGSDGKDYTVDPAQLTPGQVIFEYGYVPVVYWGTADDGSIEVGRFAGNDYGSASDFSTHRGPLPVVALPDSAISPNDRITELESQVKTLTDLLTKQFGQAAPTPAAPASDPAPAAVGSPFSVAPSQPSGGAEPDTPAA